MLTDHDPTPYDGPFNAWLLRYAQDQIGVHSSRVQEHQRQLAYHERELRFWEHTTQTLLVSQGNTTSTPSSPVIDVTRLESKTVGRARSGMPVFRNPFTEEGDRGAEREVVELTERTEREEERKDNPSLQTTQEVWESEPVDGPPTEDNENTEIDNGDNSAEPEVAAEQVALEGVEAETLVTREDAARAAAEAEEEERRQTEAEEQRRKEAEEEMQRQLEKDRVEATREQPVAPEPEPSPPVQAPTSSPTPPPGRKVPAHSPGLHADAAAVASNTALKERMARLGGLNPLAMMPGQGVPLMRPKSRVVEEDQSKPAEPEKRAADLRATQEMKPIPPEKPSAPATPTTAVPSNPTSPELGRPVKGPAPPPRKPANNATSPSGSATASPSARIAESAKSEPPKAEPKEPNKPATGSKKYCKANFDLDSPPKGCPKFKKGDIAECVEVKGEWSHVIFVKNGEEGHVPTAYFTMDVPYSPAVVAPVTAVAACAPAAVRKMKALFPFAPPKPKGFVPLKVGEIVTWEKGELGEEWWVVKNAAGLSGYVPHNYVKML